jgi:hypothetical protein
VSLSQSRLATETPTFADLIADIKRGLIKIPQFQRKFVWKEPQALDLLDSISKNYPIGSLLIWKTTEKLAIERNIGNFKLPKTDDMSPTDYVLDGQQRITVIYSTLGAPDDEEGFLPKFDLRSGLFVTTDEVEGSILFPLRWLYNTTKVLNFRTALQTYKDAQQLQERLDELIDAFSKYKLPVVTLKDLTVEEVCPIFERINSSGTKLATYDLMVAATWSEAFDLNARVDQIAHALAGKNFGKIKPDTVLKCLAAIHYSSIRQGQIINLRQLNSAEMDSLVERTRLSLLQAVDTLSTEFRIYSWDFLPYEALLIVLCYVYSRVASPSQVDMGRVRQWFWRSSFSQRYRVGGENFVSKDLQDVARFVIQAEGKAINFGVPPQPDQWARLPFRAANSLSVAFVLALASLHPRNITNSAKIDVTIALSHFNKKEFHHIFPRNYLKVNQIKGEHNAIANICMLAASENKAISDQNPQHYLPGCAGYGTTTGDTIFKSNALPLPSKFDYAKATYDAFLDKRKLIISAIVDNLCNGQHT